MTRSRRAGAPDSTAATKQIEKTEGGNVIDVSSAPSRRKPGTVSVTIDLAGAVHPIANGVASGVAAALRIDPVNAVLRGVQRSLDVANSVSRQVVVTGGRMSPLSPSRSMNSRFETFSVPGARSTGARARR